MTLVLPIATTNPHKVSQLRVHLGVAVRQVAIDLPEIQAIDVKQVIEAKAREAFRQIGEPVLVEDTGLYFEAWKGLPGALVRWFLQSVGPDGICKMLANETNRSARAETCLGLFDGKGFHSFGGVVEGMVVSSPRGEHGFGWDSIFMPEGSEKTFAEMAPEEKVEVDMRRIAALQLRAYLETAKLA